MTTVPFKDIKPGDVFTVTYQWRGRTHRVTYRMEEDRRIYLYPSLPSLGYHYPFSVPWGPLQKCERHCPG